MVMLNVSPWKGVIRFGKRSKLSPRYIWPFRIIEGIGPVAYKLEHPDKLRGIHNTFHVSNLKKCLANENLVIPLEEIQLDDKLHFIEEPVEIMDREMKQLKRSRIPTVKVTKGEGCRVRGVCAKSLKNLYFVPFYKTNDPCFGKTYAMKLVTILWDNASGLAMTQRKYALELLKCADVLNLKPIATPMDPICKLHDTDGYLLLDPSTYRTLVGYLDISNYVLDILTKGLNRFLHFNCLSKLGICDPYIMPTCEGDRVDKPNIPSIKSVLNPNTPSTKSANPQSSSAQGCNSM
ncbi:hypothetical protein Tco_1115285 [Tanacetum coccineum]